MSEKTQKNSKKRNIRIGLIVGSVVLCVTLIYDIFGLGGNIELYRKWASCGQKPVVGYGSGYMNVGVFHYADPPAFSLMRQSVKYFCTPIEAEREAYSASPNYYEFPHLEAAGEPYPDLMQSRY